MTYPSDVGPGGPNPQQYLPQPPYHQPPYLQHQHVQQSPYELQGVYAGAPEPPRRHTPVWIWVAIGVAATVAVAVLVVFVTRDEHPGEQKTAGRTMSAPADFGGYQRLSGYDTTTLRTNSPTSSRRSAPRPPGSRTTQ